MKKLFTPDGFDSSPSKALYLGNQHAFLLSLAASQLKRKSHRSGQAQWLVCPLSTDSAGTTLFSREQISMGCIDFSTVKMVMKNVFGQDGLHFPYHHHRNSYCIIAKVQR